MLVWRVALIALITLIATQALGRDYEGLRLLAYRDPGGTLTICYGHAMSAHDAASMTRAQCDALRAADVRHARRSVSACVVREVTPKQEQALEDWFFNVGATRACRSHLVRMINLGAAPSDWCRQLLFWNRVDGIEIPGLVRRRRDEYMLCIPHP